jgi:hypothetical protein
MQLRYFSSIAFFLSLAAGISSCSKLQETPYSSIFTTNFYKTASDAEGALTAAYSPVANMYYGPAALMASDFSADQTYPRPVVGRDSYTLFSYDVNYTAEISAGRTNESPQEIWTDCYTGINNADIIMENVPAIDMDTTRRDQIIGNAYYLRAFYLWMLTKNFGDVIIKTTASTDLASAELPKSAQSDVYKQIFSDLNQAIPLLQSYSASLIKGEISKEGAMALYAKAALYDSSWSTALSMAQAVINSGLYQLVPNVVDLYNVTKEDADREEVIWAFEGESAPNGNVTEATVLYGPASLAPAYGPQTFGSAFAYQAFYNSFDPADQRRLLLDTTYLNGSGQTVHQSAITPITPQGVLVKKYMDPDPISGPGGSACNVPILRLADVYLIAAEAEARMNGATALAYSYVLPVRQRAGLANLPAGLSAPDFINAVLQERSWEFFAEGDRWYDLTRTNTFLQVIPSAVNNVFPVRNPQTRNRYFPIPEREIQANPKLTQNEGWQ